MRIPVALSMTLLLLSAAVGCGDSDSGNSELDNSRAAWEDTRDAAAGYFYVRYTAAFDGEPREETTIVVVDGEVVRRNWVSLDENGDEISSWEEADDDIGMHQGAHPAVTLDDLYDQCADLFTTERGANIVLATFADGLLKDCFYGDDGIIGTRLQQIGFEE
jgi:hypothetical protein